MNVDSLLNLNAIKKFFGKHHPVIFIAVTLLLLAGAILSLYLIVDQTLSAPLESTSTVADFDQETIDKIKELQNSDDSAEPLIFPTTRINPFVE